MSDTDHAIRKEYDSLKKSHDIHSLRRLIRGQNRVVDTSEYKTKDHAISTYLRNKHGHKKVDSAFGFTKKESFQSFKSYIAEEANYKVEIEGLPTMYISASGPTELKMKLRKLLKKADMIKNVERVLDGEVRKHFRMKAQGKDDEGGAE